METRRWIVFVLMIVWSLLAMVALAAISEGGQARLEFVLSILGVFTLGYVLLLRRGAG